MSERRIAWLLAALLIAQFAMVSAQTTRQGHPLLERLAFRLVAPLAHLVSGTIEIGAVAVAGLRRHDDLVAENQHLKGELAALRAELFRLRNLERDLERDVERLSTAVGYADPPEGELWVADVVYADPDSEIRTMLIYVGDRPVEVNQPVVDPAGLIGRVVLVVSPYAKVQLITDRAATVGAMIERTRRQGLLRGDTGGGLELDFVPLQADVVKGDRLITSGIDGVYPPGIRVGTVEGVAPGDELFHEIGIAPAVDFKLVDQVYVVVRRQIPEELKRGFPDALR